MSAETLAEQMPFELSSGSVKKTRALKFAREVFLPEQKKLKAELVSARAAFVKASKKNGAGMESAVSRYDSALNTYLTFVTRMQGFDIAESARRKELGFFGALWRTQHPVQKYAVGAAAAWGALFMTLKAGATRLAVGIPLGMGLNKVLHSPIANKISHKIFETDEAIREAEHAAADGKDFKSITENEFLKKGKKGKYSGKRNLEGKYGSVSNRILTEKWTRFLMSYGVSFGVAEATHGSIAQHVIDQLGIGDWLLQHGMNDWVVNGLSWGDAFRDSLSIVPSEARGGHGGGGWGGGNGGGGYHGGGGYRGSNMGGGFHGFNGGGQRFTPNYGGSSHYGGGYSGFGSHGYGNNHGYDYARNGGSTGGYRGQGVLGNGGTRLPHGGGTIGGQTIEQPFTGCTSCQPHFPQPHGHNHYDYHQNNYYQNNYRSSRSVFNLNIDVQSQQQYYQQEQGYYEQPYPVTPPPAPVPHFHTECPPDQTHETYENVFSVDKISHPPITELGHHPAAPEGWNQAMDKEHIANTIRAVKAAGMPPEFVQAFEQRLHELASQGSIELKTLDAHAKGPWMTYADGKVETGGVQLDLKTPPNGTEVVVSFNQGGELHRVTMTWYDKCGNWMPTNEVIVHSDVVHGQCVQVQDSEQGSTYGYSSSDSSYGYSNQSVEMQNGAYSQGSTVSGRLMQIAPRGEWISTLHRLGNPSWLQIHNRSVVAPTPEDARLLHAIADDASIVGGDPQMANMPLANLLEQADSQQYSEQY